MQSLRRSMLWLFAAALLLPGLPARAAEVDKYLPDDAEIVLFLNLKQITQAPLVVKHHAMDQLRKAINKNDEVSKVLKDLGFDPLNDLTSLTAAASGIDTNSKGLLIAHGQFDLAKFEARAAREAEQRSEFLKIHKEGSHKIYEVRGPDSDKPLYVGLADKTTIVASNEKGHVLDALDRAAGKKPGAVKKEVKALIEKEQADQTLWLVAPGSALSKSDLTAAAEEKTRENLKKIESLSAGLTVANDIKLALSVVTKSTENAKELEEEIKQGLNQLKGLLAIAAGDRKELASAVEALGALKVVTKGKTVSVKANVTEEAIEKGIKKGKQP